MLPIPQTIDDWKWTPPRALELHSPELTTDA
jgi:hypothetical protein